MNTTTTKTQNLVTSIPSNIDMTGTINLNVKSYAGYANSSINGKKAGIFYWFFESQSKKTKDTPIIMWFNGGPGASSTLGLFLENGPYTMKDDGNIVENPYSWNKDAHIIYWDQPIGTGYSMVYDEDPQTTFVENEDQLSQMLYEAFNSFLEEHDEYSDCPIYIMGESYGGKYVPNIALKFDEHGNKNLKGIAVGDGWINSRLQMKNYIDYVYTLGYMDSKQYEIMNSEYKQFAKYLDLKIYDRAYTLSNNMVDEASSYGGNFDVYDIRSFKSISMDNVKTYMSNKKVKEILNVPTDKTWECADNTGPVANNLIEDNMIDSSNLYSELIKQTDKYKILMYAATFDTACGALSTEMILNDISKWGNEKDNEMWFNASRNIWKDDDDIPRGFVKNYKNLTQIIIPNSGHQVPYFQPKASLDMINRFIK
ncbi:MAG: S10 family peptidase [Peptostreptococcaceae bacterium]|jgi:vitellogenic carboxypeptidase-like protein|nr:S10 family peptidase [Peptostreptococcaceae bacterium]